MAQAAPALGALLTLGAVTTGVLPVRGNILIGNIDLAWKTIDPNESHRFKVPFRWPAYPTEGPGFLYLHRGRMVVVGRWLPSQWTWQRRRFAEEANGQRQRRLKARRHSVGA